MFELVLLIRFMFYIIYIISVNLQKKIEVAYAPNQKYWVNPKAPQQNKTEEQMKPQQK